MEFNKDMYMAAKQAGELAKRHEKKKTLWKEEELELEYPMEYAGEQEMPGVSSDMNVSPAEVAPEAADIISDTGSEGE